MEVAVAHSDNRRGLLLDFGHVQFDRERDHVLAHNRSRRTWA